jgi:uncharacterized protein (DUF1499 family)
MMALNNKSSWLTKSHSGLLVLTVLVFVAAALSGTGYANEWWDIGTAFRILGVSAIIAGGIAVIAIVTLWIMALKRAHSEGRLVRGFISVILFTACLGFAYNVYDQFVTAQIAPPIHDVTTDLIDIPQFAVLNPQNPNNDNWEIQHKAGYGTLKPLELDMSVEDVIVKAEKASVDFGWNVAAMDLANGRLEVTETTKWFSFKDDLVLRVRAKEGGGSIVDARSVSRFAGSDIGVNAARIRKLFAALQD